MAIIVGPNSRTPFTTQRGLENDMEDMGVRLNGQMTSTMRREALKRGWHGDNGTIYIIEGTPENLLEYQETFEQEDDLTVCDLNSLMATLQTIKVQEGIGIEITKNRLMDRES